MKAINIKRLPPRRSTISGKAPPRTECGFGRIALDRASKYDAIGHSTHKENARVTHLYVPPVQSTSPSAPGASESWRFDSESAPLTWTLKSGIRTLAHVVPMGTTAGVRAESVRGLHPIFVKLHVRSSGHCLALGHYREPTK
jgi:hypothetical protein